MANITFDSQEVSHHSIAQIGTTGLYYAIGFAFAGFALFVGMNWVVQGALQGLVAVLGGGA